MLTCFWRLLVDYAAGAGLPHASTLQAALVLWRVINIEMSSHGSQH